MRAINARRLCHDFGSNSIGGESNSTPEKRWRLASMKTDKYNKPALILACVLSLASAAYGQAPALNDAVPVQLNLMPAPFSVQTQTGRLAITGGFRVAVRGYADDRLRAGIARMLTWLAGRTVRTLPAGLAAHEC